MMNTFFTWLFSFSREKPTPLTQTQISTGDVGKRLFESGTYKDPRLMYDVSIISNLYFIY